VVAHRSAPLRSPVWKTGVLGDGRMSHGRCSQSCTEFSSSSGRRVSAYATQRKSGARDECCPRFMFRSTGGRRCCSTSRAWWPARVTLPALPLKRRLHRCNACRPEVVLQYGAAPSSAAYQATALLLSYRRFKMVVRLGTAPSLPS
jgi:hypothetical protein